MPSFLYISLLTVLFILLSVNIIVARFKTKTALLSGGHWPLSRAIRAQGNFNEYTPLFCLILMILDFQDYEGFIIHFIGSLYFIGRMCHAYSLLISEKYDENNVLITGSYPRMAGMFLTFTMLSLEVMLLFWLYISSYLEA